MQDGLYVGLSAQVALEQRLTTLAENVANSRTVGFRATHVRFEEVLTRAQQNEPVSYVSPGREVVSNDSGGLEQTGNQLDFAIDGNAWFAVNTEAGMIMTKDGRFTLQADGVLTTLSGNEVLDAGGAPIQLNAAGGEVVATTDGILRQNGQAVAGLGLYSFDPGSDFQRYGDSGFVSNATSLPIVDDPTVGVRQGYVEQSNVNPVHEITRLIAVQRSFEQASSLMEQADQSLNRLIQALDRS